jgi:exoribonuclease R
MKVLGRNPVTAPKQPLTENTQAPAANANVQLAHETNDFRPLTAGEIRPGERVIKEFPNAQFGAAKLKQIAAAATGEVASILGKAANAAERIAGNQALNGRREDGQPPQNEGRVIREVRVVDGQHQVRVVFKPAMGRPTPLTPDAVEGIPNGAVVRLKGDGTVDTAGARTLNNMIGTVEKRNGGYVVVAKSQQSPIDVLPLEGGSDELVGKLVLVDVQNPTQRGRKGLIHDVLTPKNEMQRLELTAAADAGVPLTFPPAVLKQLQELKNNPPQFDLKPGMRDLRNLPVIATDNPGSRSDYKSVDPEQASNVSFEGGRMVVTDFLANRKLIVPKDSPIDAHAMEVMQTFYGSGFDAAALPMELSEDLAVFLADKPRYATAVRAVYDVIPETVNAGVTLTDEQRRVVAQFDGKKTLTEVGAAIGDEALATRVVRELGENGSLVVGSRLRLDDSEVFDALITNRWAGSYRDADRVYASEKGDRQFDAVVQGLPAGVKEQLDAFKFAGAALREQAKDRGQLNAGNDDDGRYQSEQIREAFSTSINEVVALIADKAGVDTIQRFHPEAKEEKLTRFREFASAFGVPWPEGETFAAYVDKIPERVAAKFAEKSEPERAIIQEAVKIQAYRTLEKAIYSVGGGGHAGLAKAMYAHASASNRQNTGKPNLDMATYASDKLQGRAAANAPYTKEQLTEIAEHATGVELLYARVIERQIDNLRNAVELKPFEGQKVKAVIVGVNPGGIELKTLEPGSKVFVPLAALGDAFRSRFDISESNTQVRAQRGGATFAVAQTIELTIKSVNTELGSIDALPVIDATKLPAREEQNNRGDRGGGRRNHDVRNDDRQGRRGRHRGGR